LATLDRRFAGGAILYDPTAIFGRAAEAVRCADMIRAALGNKAGRILLDTARRTLYVVLNGRGFKGEGLVFRAQVAEAMAALAKTVSAWKQDAPANFELAFRVGFDAPGGLRLVPVDDQSRERRHLRMLSDVAGGLRKAAGVVAVGAVAAGAPSIAYAGEADPTAAVSQPNLALIGQGDYLTGHDSHSNDFMGEGGIEGTVPLGHSFGFQADGGIGSDSYYGVGGHLFWRDPNWGLIGGFASDESLDSIKMQRYGGEAELYLDRLTISARAGGQSGDIKDGAFGKLDLSFYATDSFAIRAGVETSPHVTFGHAGFEFQPAAESMPGLSLFADGSVGEGTRILFGIKFHFGEPGASLMYRDRHEDPLTSIFNDIPLVAALKHYIGPHPT